MAFHIVHPESHQTSWVPILAGQVAYVGQIVAVDSATPLEGVRPLPIAAQDNNYTNMDIPMGIVIGFNANACDAVFSSAKGVQQMTGTAVGSSYHSTSHFRGVEGPWSRGDKIAMAHIHHIDPSTVIRGDLFDTTYGVAPPEVLVTTGCGGDGIGCTTGASTVDTIINWSTIYMRSGENLGIYRTLTTASSTVHAWLQGMPQTINIGDKAYVLNGLRPYGAARCQFDATATFIDTNAALTADYHLIHVRRLDLSVPGKEYVEFRFDASAFSAWRAAA
jgi:hypothetical protein